MFEGSPSMAFFGSQYVQAAGVGCMVELRLRLAIDTGNGPRKEAYEPPIGAILKVFGTQFSAALLDDEMAFLEKAVSLRHKIAHGDFLAAHRIARELGAKLEAGGVWKASLVSDDDDDIRPVATTTKKGGRNFGWFLEAGQSGLFLEATNIFHRAFDIINRVLPG